MKERLKFMFVLFCAVTTLQILYMSVHLLFIILSGTYDGYPIVFAASELFRVLIVAFASTLPCLIFIGTSGLPKTLLAVRNIVHFALTAGIVFGLLFYFGTLNAFNAIGIALIFLAIYIVAAVRHSFMEKKLADELNKRIIAFHEGENATHRNQP